ncbi:hypothetical protein IKP13_08885, partial [bacterium]|nr:hypothetical protein [bacterium]
MKTLATFLFLIPLFLYSSADDDIESAGSLAEGREIAPLPRTDERINGYREDYKKPSENLIELPKKYRKKEKEKEKKPEEKPAAPELSEEAEKTEENKNVSHETLPPKQESKPVQTFHETSLPPEPLKPAEKPKPKPGYYGQTFDGLRDGKGKLVLENGDVYEGNWKEGQKNGQGIYLYASGIKYNGTWKNDKM